MTEILAKTFKELADKAKDLKEYVPSFLEKEKVDNKGTEDIKEPVERKNKEGFTEYQKELLVDEYGLTDEDIAQYTDWDDFEEKLKAEKLETGSNEVDNPETVSEETAESKDTTEEDDDDEKVENPHQEKVDGKTYYYDDNGKLYRVENDLEPNSEYEINGYKYKTDEQGRIVSAEGTLHMKERDGRLVIKDSIEDIGKGDQKENDDRGHLIGDQFDGSNGLENMIPQDADINRNDFRNFENELAKEVKDGKEVKVKIEPIYDGDSRRPDAIVVTYSIDGEESVRVFPNGQEE